MTRVRSPTGFTVVELALATTIALTVIASVVAIVMPAQNAFVVQPEAADVQQRVRVAVETLMKDLRTAGTRMPVSRGALDVPLAPVLPYRIGTLGSEAAARRYYQPGVISVVQVAAPLSGSNVPQLISRTYYLKTTAPDVSQLMQYNGQQGDFPVLDDVVGLAFDVFGDPLPPRLQTQAGGDSRPRVSYGPRPPAIDRDDPVDGWGPGENCLWTVVDGTYRSRLPALPGDGNLVLLAASVLTDGPWCPDDDHEDRFDADLLRIRRVRVHVRVQAQRAFRGPQGTLFARGGTATGNFHVPDLHIRFDVAPRDMNRGQ